MKVWRQNPINITMSCYLQKPLLTPSLNFFLLPTNPPQKSNLHFHGGGFSSTTPSPSLIAAAVKGSSGMLSAIGKAMEEEEEYRRARSEVQKKSVNAEGYAVEGISIGGHETCIVVPQIKSAFDIGRCPSRAIHQNFLFITHAHLDHIGGLPMYVATRGLYNLKPPTVFVPPCIKEDVEKLLDVHRSMGDVELNVDLVALEIGDTYEMRNDLVVRSFKTDHVIPSQGYVVYSVRKKLRKQYSHLKGQQIEKLKKSGVEITDTILCPELAFTGDTRSDFFLDPRNADALRAKILITEATFLDENVPVEHARDHGHTHLFEIMEHAQWIRNKTILLTHFSPRYSIEDIRQAVMKLQTKVSAKVVALTEGFKSMHTQGARLVATLLHEMKRCGEDWRFGVISMCIDMFIRNPTRMCWVSPGTPEAVVESYA